MNDRPCIVCGEYGRHTLGIRARYGKQRDAVWAPELHAYLCDTHAKSGCEIAIAIGPTTDGLVTTATSGAHYTVKRAIEIGTGREIDPDQGSLL